MSPHSTVNSARIFYAVFGTATVAAFLVRVRLGMSENPAPAHNTVGAVLLSRMSGLAHFAFSASETVLSLLLRIALAPVNVTLSAMEFVFRTAFAAIDGAGIILHLAPLLLLHAI
jgi:hypothetical protein